MTCVPCDEPNAEWANGSTGGVNATGIVLRHCGLDICKNAKTKENVSIAHVVRQDSVR